MQHTYNVKMRQVHTTIVAKEKQ